MWSPPGVHAWIAKTDVTALKPDEDGAKLWAQALSSLPPAPQRAEEARQGSTPPAAKPETKPTAEKPAEKDPALFTQALEAAFHQMEEERTKDTPDWPSVRALFASAEAAANNGAEVTQVRQGLETLGAFEEASRLRARLEQERLAREEQARREQERVWELSRAKDPLGGVFLARGALERVGEGDAQRYLLRFGTDVSAEILCVSGRYDLDLFTGYHVGVKGMELPLAASDAPRRIEVTRLEVIARRP